MKKVILEKENNLRIHEQGIGAHVVKHLINKCRDKAMQIFPHEHARART